MQEDYYNRKHRDIRYAVGDYVLLSTQNLRVKGVPQKLQRKFCGPFRIEQVIGLKHIDYSYLRTGVSTLFSMYPYLNGGEKVLCR